MDGYKPPEVPEWLKWLASALDGMGPALPYIFWGFVALLVLGLLYFIVPRLIGTEWPWKRKKAEAEVDWRPDESVARRLLAEAEALAAQGNYSEAAHLLLFRSIEDIDARRPKLVRPALTSRDIVGAGEIPDRPRAAFSDIVGLVERSLFGGRDLVRDDWDRCKSAYEQFALAEAWR